MCLSLFSLIYRVFSSSLFLLLCVVSCLRFLFSFLFQCSIVCLGELFFFEFFGKAFWLRCVYDFCGCLVCSFGLCEVFFLRLFLGI